MPSTDMLKGVLSTLAVFFYDYLSDTTITTLFSLNSQPVHLSEFAAMGKNGKLLDTYITKKKQ